MSTLLDKLHRLNEEGKIIDKKLKEARQSYETTGSQIYLEEYLNLDKLFRMNMSEFDECCQEMMIERYWKDDDPFLKEIALDAIKLPKDIDLFINNRI